ncbi:MAG: hypothetical protein AB1423_14345 [Pseudomonadota bacterium]
MNGSVRGGRSLMDMNGFARKITLKEGKKQSLSIAQVKEVVRLTLKELALLSPAEALKVIGRYR